MNSSRDKGLKSLIDATLLALEQMDADALEQLASRAEAMRTEVPDAAGVRAAAAGHRTLGELLKSTERNISLLRRLHGAALSSEESNCPQQSSMRQSGMHGSGPHGHAAFMSACPDWYGAAFRNSYRQGAIWLR